MKYLVTGGCGFIGANFCHLLNKKNHEIFVLDKLTYAANIDNLKDVKFKLIEGDINDSKLVKESLEEYKIDVLVHFAAESHVDNSISNPGIFIQTNINGTFNLLNESLKYQENKNPNFKFIHISTDEVFGDLEINDPKFNENTNYKPSSPYSASKAASDHLVRAWIKTYKLNASITNCSNNYGLFQNTEKLIPKIITNCIKKENINLYGNGLNIRDWIWAEDHCLGIYLAIENFKIGESYCFGGDCERTNLDIANTICNIFNEKFPNFNYKNLIKFTEDRKGHDFRYAIDSSKAKEKLGFDNKNGSNFEGNIRYLVDYFIKNYK